MEQLKKFKWHIAAIAFVLVVVYTLSTTPVEAYKFIIDGEEVGFISDKAYVETLLKTMDLEYSDNENYEVSQTTEVLFEKGLISEKEILTQETIDYTLRSKLQYELTGYTIVIDGEPFYTLKSNEEAEMILDRIKVQYASPENAEDTENEIKDIRFLENVEIVTVNPEKDDISTMDTVWEAYELGKQELQTYKVAQGDTTWDIANRFNMSIEDIAQANVEKDLTRIQIGQIINLNLPKAWINVRSTVVTENEQPMLGLTYYEKTDSMYVGEHKLKTQGEDGLKVVELESVYVNGILQEERILSELVITEPTNTVMLSGSKWREVASTGEFNNPTNGVLTSRFGSRWGRMHEGIDIGAPVGTAIRAADAGVVTASKYISGYGNTVIVDHGGGITTLYGHASTLKVVVGQTVQKNELIALVGRTGSTTGSCLHFEVRKNGVAIDPLPYVNY